jgi:hypothetical protein
MIIKSEEWMEIFIRQSVCVCLCVYVCVCVCVCVCVFEWVSECELGDNSAEVDKIYFWTLQGFMTCS